MNFLLDSDWVADFLDGRQSATELFEILLPIGSAISVVSYVEVVEGIRGSHRRDRMNDVFLRLLDGIALLDLDQAIADRAADICLDLRRRKRQVNERAMDIVIAATAVEHGLTLVTRNIRDYDDIPDLQIFEKA